MQRTSKRTLRWAAALCVGVLFVLTPAASPCFGQDKPKEEKSPKEEKKEEEKEDKEEKKEKDKEGDDDSEKASRTGKGRGKPDKNSKIKPYDEVITEDADTVMGLFRTHRVGEKLYYELPAETLDQEMLWVSQVAKTTAGSSYAGMPARDRVVRWELRNESVLLRDVRYGIRADTDDSIANAVEASNLAPIIRAFDVVAWGADKRPVIDVTDLFTKDVPEFSARNTLGAGAMDPKRSFVEKVQNFPTNIEVQVLASFAPSRPTGAAAAARRPSAPTSSGISAMIHHSMIQLPEMPMKPRRFDRRVGFFSVGFVDFADDSNHQAERVRYITRWRLEKKKPKAKLSEPKKPIVFYVGRGTPDKWKPYVKAGIEQWQPAFESAGFKNAILGKYAPTPQEDPTWDPEDARISVIRWLPSAIENAFGPHVSDPRTGEILEADVRMYHNVQKLVRDWYFVQAGATDPRLKDLPMPDDLVGELIQFVVAHEVGHSLGFPHNMKASSAYTVAQLRDPEWTKKNGTAPSIMDYARFNYVAQPGDNAGLMPQVGPYDHFAAEWGYREFAEGKEAEGLKALFDKQIDEPMFRFGGRSISDSTQQTEDLTGDAVAATELGLKNLERIADNLVDATSTPGDDYELLSNMHQRVLGQWAREMGHVANVVGGVRQDNLYYGDADARFAPNDADYQRRAVRFLLDNALTTPTPFIDPNIVMRLTGNGVANTVLGSQQRILRSLVRTDRIDRMAEHTAGNSSDYSPAEFMNDIREGVFSELAAAETPDLYRRNLQRAYIEHLGRFLSNPSGSSDLPALARLQLEKLRSSLESVSGGSEVMEAHAADLLARIETAFKAEGDGVPSNPFLRGLIEGAAGVDSHDLDCWHDDSPAVPFN